MSNKLSVSVGGFLLRRCETRMSSRCTNADNSSHAIALRARWATFSTALVIRLTAKDSCASEHVRTNVEKLPPQGSLPLIGMKSTLELKRTEFKRALQSRHSASA